MILGIGRSIRKMFLDEGHIKEPDNVSAYENYSIYGESRVIGA